MEKKQINKSTPSLGIFIFYQDPDLEYWNTLQSFLCLSLCLKKSNIFKYSVSNYREEIGYIDIITLISDDIRRIGKHTFHNIIIYVENSMLLASNYYNDVYWYNMFDNYTVNYLVFIYNEPVKLNELLFPFKLSFSNDNIRIDNYLLDTAVIHKNTVILNHFNIEHFCLSVLESIHNTKLIDFMVEQYVIQNHSIEMFTNFIPTNDIHLFYNYNSNSPIDLKHIIPIYISKFSLKLLDDMFFKICKTD
jgi:hypothetical protein